MTNDQLQAIVESISDLRNDSTVPKNVKSKLGTVVEILEHSEDLSLDVDKVMNIFDELNEDSNIDSFTRTQLWNIVSCLEAL